MAFLLYKKVPTDGQIHYQAENKSFSLAGYNLIYKLWEKNERPFNRGWSVSADDLLQAHGDAFHADVYSLVIDFHPNADYRIALIEIENIYLYTYGDKEKSYVYWSPMMLELKSLYYDEFDEVITKEEKEELINNFPAPDTQKRIVEFLYLNGDDYSWNWGKNGMTNAAFIEEDAREYFKQYF